MQIARWAHMHHFLSVSPSVCPDLTKNIGKKYDVPMKFGTGEPYLLLHSKKDSCREVSKVLLLRQVGLIGNFKLRFGSTLFLSVVLMKIDIRQADN